MITCKECKYSDNCPCGYSLHNAACLVIQKPKDKKKKITRFDGKTTYFANGSYIYVT